MNSNLVVSTPSEVLPLSLEARRLAQERASAAGLVLFLGVMFGLGLDHQAHAFLGQGVIAFAKNYIVAPLGVVSLLVALGASVINPMFLKSAIYTTLICAAMFVIMANAGDLIDAISRN